MPISVKFPDLEFGQTWYVKDDPMGSPYKLIGVILLPGKQVKFLLSFHGDTLELYDFECTLEPPAESSEL